MKAIKKYLYKNDKTGQYTDSNQKDWGLIQAGYRLLTDEEKRDYEEKRKNQQVIEGDG